MTTAMPDVVLSESPLPLPGISREGSGSSGMVSSSDSTPLNKDTSSVTHDSPSPTSRETDSPPPATQIPPIADDTPSPSISDASSSRAIASVSTPSTSPSSSQINLSTINPSPISSKLNSTTVFHDDLNKGPEGMLSSDDLNLPAPSPLFPSPSSSFRPPPESETNISQVLDERIFKEKNRHLEKEKSDISTSSSVAGPSSPNLAPSRPPSRPSSSTLSRTSSRRSTLGTRTRSERAISVSSNQHSPNPSYSDTLSPRDAWIAPLVLSDVVKIRDFAFEKSDPRFGGGRLVYDELERSGSASDDTRNEYGQRLSPGIGNEEFSNSTSSGQFSWGFVTSHQEDFTEDDSQIYSEDEQESEGPEELPAIFIPGIYEALYDFYPEPNSTEMAIDCGDIITVFSRECAGWVQAGKARPASPSSPTSEVVGLVPENYLRLIEADPTAGVSQGEGEDEWAEEIGGEDESEYVAGSPLLDQEDYGEEVSTPRPTTTEESTTPLSAPPDSS